MTCIDVLVFICTATIVLYIPHNTDVPLQQPASNLNIR
jgi:hypothetical protein